MWRPDPAFDGPYRPADGDIASLNDAFALSFTDRYRRDGLPNVRVPHLNRAVWEFAIADAGEGAMIWRDRAGRVVAFNLAHCSGHEGWMGPLAVRPDLQGGGSGNALLQEAERVAREEFGLPVMRMTVIDLREELIAWYVRRGYRRTGIKKPFPATDPRFGLPKRDDLRFEVLEKEL